ncbi:hypothetical protein [Limobrevibacterium gyesilva]|uniref:Uncharacterized protein n=1 Tax=Limobrevibacterium gyesilva TaxID=2991712 RepID=A0AA41YS40_9PROT|nr:hypothetical protein [Limobrevibacterium gyesilva]MCW3477532.1 hypothetical protein [Limobrevibacterium gyesilva]
MTRKGRAKSVNAASGTDRLKLARAYLKAARNEVLLAEPGDIGNPAMSHIVTAAIAFTDALTASYAGRANQQDHAATVKALCDALGARLKSRNSTLASRSDGHLIQSGNFHHHCGR